MMSDNGLRNEGMEVIQAWTVNGSSVHLPEKVRKEIEHDLWDAESQSDHFWILETFNDRHTF